MKESKVITDALEYQEYQREMDEFHQVFLNCYELSAREAFIAWMLVRGEGIIAIADYYSISPMTVTSHIKNIYRKLRIHDKTELVAWYHTKYFEKKSYVRRISNKALQRSFKSC